MTEPASGGTNVPPYQERYDAPVVYFDVVAANGMINGAIEIELAHRVLTPLPDGGVRVILSTSGRLRCSPAAARALIEGLEKSLKMLEQPQTSATAAPSKLN